MLVTLSMKNSIIILVLSLFSFQAVAQKSPSEELFDAAMNSIVPAEKFVWNWRDAVLLKAFTDIYRAQPQQREAIADYVDRAMTRLSPKAHGIHPNGVASAVGLAFLAGPHVHLHKAPCTHAAPKLSSVRTEQETE